MSYIVLHYLLLSYLNHRKVCVIYIKHYVVAKNECESRPCRNGGTCTDAVDGYTCECAPGYNDANCGTGISEIISDVKFLDEFKS